jgi:adenylosuccinate synthase
MALTVVVGGQYGSEGKGKISAIVAKRDNIDIAVRCGGPNSGHSFLNSDGSLALLRQLPTAAVVDRRSRLLIPAGALVDLTVLRKEMTQFDIDPARVGVDRNAMIIEETDKEAEAEIGLGERLSSTLCGVGHAAARRVLRGAEVRLATDAMSSHPWLRDLLVNVSDETNEALDRGSNVVVEGTQGFGLSLYHSDHYPKTTSRDTTASGFLSEAGISPRRVDEIVLVLRTFPIRVAGEQAGPMREEISWETIQAESGAPEPVREFTTVSKKLRRVARFDWNLARSAVNVNRPTTIALNFIDYLSYSNRGRTARRELTANAQAFVAAVEATLKTKVGMIGTGPGIADVIFCDRDLGERRESAAS